MRRRYTLADTRASYDAQKRAEEWHGDWMSALLYRPLSFFLTPPLLNLGITASQVTALGLLLALALPAAALFWPSHLAVALLAIAFVILDCVDGNIARVTATASKSGHYFDFLTDIVFRIALYAAIGLLADGGRGALFLALGLMAALLSVLARLCRVFVRQLSPGDVFNADARASGVIDRVLLPFLSGFDRLLPFLVLLGPAYLGWVLAWLLAYGAADLIYTQWAVFRRLKAEP